METETETEAEAAAAVMMRTMKTAETVVNWEVGQIIGMDSEGTMSDDDGTGAEATAECF
jgi:hypothetical protein